MPTYEFECQTCHVKFQQSMHIGEPADHIVCPNGHTDILKRFSVPSVIFKGSGWYSTDHRRSTAGGGDAG